MREMAKNCGFAKGGYTGNGAFHDWKSFTPSPLFLEMDYRLCELLKLRPLSYNSDVRIFLDTEESTIRYQEVILGIERRWDAVMKQRNNNN